MLNIAHIREQRLASEPYGWAAIDQLFSPEDASSLIATFPDSHFREFAGYDGEKSYRYQARSLIHMGAEAVSHGDVLSPVWQRLAEALLSPEYRQAMIQLTGLDLAEAWLEANLTDYGADAWLGPHVDLREKLVTHVLYFNPTWCPEDGGSLQILRSCEPDDIACAVAPLAGNSVVLVRSDRSWHSVARVRDARRCALNVIFHLRGSVSSMWAPRPRPGLLAWRSRLSSLRRKVAALQ